MAVSKATLESMDRDELVETVAGLRGTVEDLDARLDSLEAQVSALQTQNRLLKQVLAGTDDEFATWNVDNMVPMHDRLEELADTVAEHDSRFEMFVVEDGRSASPDERAMHLRQVLLNRADNEDGIAKMTRDSATMALGGNPHKGTVLDAMRRAADGHDANIDGSSDLEPVDAIEFNVGGTVGSDGTARQSQLRLQQDRLTGTEARQILTTERGGREGSS